jgi:hypothetical protein
MPTLVESIDVYSLVSLTGRLLVLLDLAVRRAGYGPEIEFYLARGSGITRTSCGKSLSRKDSDAASQPPATGLQP